MSPPSAIRSTNLYNANARSSKIPLSSTPTKAHGGTSLGIQQSLIDDAVKKQRERKDQIESEGEISVVVMILDDVLTQVGEPVSCPGRRQLRVFTLGILYVSFSDLPLITTHQTIEPDSEIYNEKIYDLLESPLPTPSLSSSSTGSTTPSIIKSGLDFFGVGAKAKAIGKKGLQIVKRNALSLKHDGSAGNKYVEGLCVIQVHSAEVCLLFVVLLPFTV